MKITSTQYAKSLYELTVGRTQQETDGVISNFLKVLAGNRQMKLAAKIIEKFSIIHNEEQKIIEAEVVSREALSDEMHTKISNYVSNKYQAKEVMINNKIDEGIKGGIIIRVGDEIMDGSVARQLQELKDNLVK